MNNINVTKRDGRLEPLNVSKIKKYVNFTCHGTYISPVVFETKLHAFFYDGIKTSDIAQLVIQTAMNNASEEEPDWVKVAGRAAMWDLYRNIYKNTKFDPTDWKKHIQYLIDNEYYNKDILNIINRFGIEDDFIDYYGKDDIRSNNNDFKKVISQVYSLMNKYLIKSKDGDYLEYPFLAKLANSSLLSDDKAMFKKYFEYLQIEVISLATPFETNLRRLYGNLGSCYIGEMHDNIHNIFKSYRDMGLISKEGGGIGWYVGKLRPGFTKTKRIHKSKPISAWMKIINDIAIAVDQNGIRQAAITIGCDWWHMDIDEFIEIRSELGDDLRYKCFDLYPQVIIDSYFTEKVMKNEDVYLFNHYYFKELTGIDITELIDEDLVEAHIAAKQLIECGKLTHYKKVNARQHFKKMVWEWLAVGKFYITHKDNLNLSNYLKHDPVNPMITKSANLCVSYDTKILTKEYGNIEIGELVEKEITKVTAWNGEEWSETPIFKTAEDYDRMYQVTIKKYKNHDVFDTDTVTIAASDYHKWYNAAGQEFRTHELRPGMMLEEYKEPDTGINISSKILDITELEDRYDLYCGTEPKRNKLVFNGILTGNCIESFSVTKGSTAWKEEVKDNILTTIETDGYYHSCNLISLNAVKLDEMEDNEFYDVCYAAVDMLDKSVELSIAPVKEANKTSVLIRNIGIGILGSADTMAKNEKMYDTDEGRLFGKAFMEKIAYYTYKASIDLAKKKGAYPAFRAENYTTLFGKDPKVLNELSRETGNNFDWVALLEDIRKYGIRNFLLLAIAPNTSSSPKLGVSASYLPVHAKFNYESLMGMTVPIVPVYLKDKYWYYKTRFQYKPEDIIKYTAELQDFVDTGISMELNMTVDNSNINDIAKTMIQMFHKKKIKGVYYSLSVDSCTDCAN